MHCAWDVSSLPHILGMCASSYEHHAVTGSHQCYTEFETAVGRTIPEGSSFRAYPCSFTHTDARRIFAAMSRERACKDMLLLRGVDKARFAIRTRVYRYPEGRIAVWVVLGVVFVEVE
jgi:centrosomal protein CEP76